MVSVKRGGKWVKIKPGQSIGNVSVPKKTSTGRRSKDIYIPIDDVKRDSKTGAITIKPTAPVYKRSSGSNFIRTGTTTATGVRAATQVERVKDPFTAKQRQQIVEKRLTDAQIRAAGMQPEVYYKQKRTYEQRQKDIKSGKLQGYSGHGLSPSEFQKRNLLIRLGVLNEKSSMSTLRNVAPLMTEYFIDTKPTAKEKANFINYIKSNAFSTALVLTPKPHLNAMQKIASRMNATINQITKTNNRANIIRLNNSVEKDKNRLLQFLRLNHLVTQRVGREAMLFSLYISKTFFGLAGTGLDEVKRQHSIAKVVKKKIEDKDKVKLLAKGIIATTKIGKNTWKVAKGSASFVKSMTTNKGFREAVWKKSVVGGKVVYKFGTMVVIETGKDLWATGKLLFVHPGLAIAKIGVDYVVLRGTGKVFSVAGTMSKTVVKPLGVVFRPIKNSKFKVRIKSPIAYMTKDVSKLKNRIEELEKFRTGAMNAAYLKAKNAGVGSGVRGKTKSYGSVKQLTPTQISVIGKEATKRGISRNQLLEGSFYRQQIRIKSLVPKYEAHLKWVRAKLKGNKKAKLGKFSKYYVFTRYGIVVSTIKKGVSKAIAVEFNKVGGKISHIGYKTAVGEGDKALVTIFKKARKVKGIPARVRVEGMFIVKNKISTTESGGKGLVRILNTLETKKVFMDGKRISRRKLLDLKTVIKKSVRIGRTNMDKFLSGLWKDGFLTGRSGTTNTVQLKRMGRGFEKVKIRILKKKQPLIKPKIYAKGQYVEIGHTQFRIPTRKVLRIGEKKPVRKMKKVKIKRRGGIVTLKKIPKVRTISSPSLKLKIKPKKGLSKLKQKQLERAVRSIQTITRPTTRRVGKRIVKSKTKVISKSAVKKLSRTISGILPLIASKNISALKAAQANLNDSIKATSSLHKSKLKSEAVKALKTISIPKSFLTISQPIRPKPKRKIFRPVKKKIPLSLLLPKGKKKKKVLKKRKDYGYTTSVKRKKVKKLTRIPLTKKRALDILAYDLDRTPSSRGRLIKSIRKRKQSVLKRQLKSVPLGYFTKNRKKFTLRKLKKGRETYEMIEKKKFRKDKKTERKRVVRRKRK